MSVLVSGLVWERSEHKGSELLTLLAIADYAHDDGIAWPGYDELASKTRLQKRAIQYIVKKLLGGGELTLVRQGGGRRSNVYRVEVDVLRGKHPRKLCTSDPAQGLHPSGAGSFVSGAQAAAPEPSVEPSPEPSSPPGPPLRGGTAALDGDGDGLPTPPTRPSGKRRRDESRYHEARTRYYHALERWARHNVPELPPRGVAASIATLQLAGEEVTTERIRDRFAGEGAVA